MVDPSQQVLTAGFWVVEKEISSFTNDLRFSVDLTDSNALTFGVYYADYSSKDRWWLGNNMLLTAQDNARRVNLALSNGQVATRDGFVGTAFYNIRGDYDGQNTAFFIADEWTVNERIRLDAGVRYERQDVNGTVWDPVTRDLDGNPNTLYDNAVNVLGGSRQLRYADSAWGRTRRSGW